MTRDRFDLCQWSGHSDVCLTAHPGVYLCRQCSLGPGGTVRLPDAQAAIEHLREHAAAGDRVPGFVWGRLAKMRGDARPTPGQPQGTPEAGGCGDCTTSEVTE